MMLRGLRAEGKRLLTPELASGEVPRWGEREYAPLLLELERRIALDALDHAVDLTLAATPAFEPASDVLLAPRLHRALPLSRREASSPAPWRFLSVVHRPDLVRHRWENRSWASMRARFWSNGTRPDSNVFCRLWWIAELSRDGDDYSLTEAVLTRPSLATGLFIRALSSHRPAVAACCQVLADASSNDVEATLKLLHKTLSTLVLEALSFEQLCDLITRLRARAGG
jgi:hypothetical protein